MRAQFREEGGGIGHVLNDLRGKNNVEAPLAESRDAREMGDVDGHAEHVPPQAPVFRRLDPRYLGSGHPPPVVERKAEPAADIEEAGRCTLRTKPFNRPHHEVDASAHVQVVAPDGRVQPVVIRVFNEAASSSDQAAADAASGEADGVARHIWVRYREHRPVGSDSSARKTWPADRRSHLIAPRDFQARGFL